ncbi:MAG: copper amine oxidase N-terminal domain-containing protein [Candidatus Eremiobacteraeota bacterium]|nr:copper amine oxidase N-terminal domain-containing protein [Candidatus Eremiobacteraeota bacterium]
MTRLFSIFLLLAAFAAPSFVAAQSVTVVVNGQNMNFTQPPIVRAGRVFVPLRGVFEQLGASVVYSNGQINATGRGRTVSLNIGSEQATVDGQPQTMDVAPFIVSETTFVPLRFISQALGASVNWNDSTSTVTISGGGGAPVPMPPQQPPSAVRFVNVSPTGTVFNPNQTIQFQFSRGVRPSALRVRVDGNSVTSGLSQSGRVFSVNVPWPLSRGPHHVRVNGMTVDGVPFDLSWDFARA